MVYLFILIGVVVVAAVLAQAWVLRAASRQQRRIDHRLDGLAGRIAAGAEPSAPAALLAPWFDLADIAGERGNLSRLLAPARPLVLIFTDPRCSPCYQLLPDIGGWQRVYGDRLTLALVSGGGQDANRAMTAEYGIAPGSVLLQDDHEIAEAYGVSMAPAAVLVRLDGRLGGDVVYGVDAVRQLVADTLGLAMPETPAHEDSVLAAGDPVPAIFRPNLDGNAVDLAATLRGEPTLLLFWSPGCTHCQELLPAMRAWESDPDGPRLQIVSRGPVALNQEAGLRSMVVLDDDQAVAGRFGVMSSPVAFAIDGLGTVASPMARGTSRPQAAD
jgi:thiol-disulfide isomerase/thioredoxin